MRRGDRAGKANRQVNMILNAPGTETFAIGVAGDRGEISVEGRAHSGIEDGGSVLGAEDEVVVEAQIGRGCVFLSRRERKILAPAPGCGPFLGPYPVV